MVRRQQRRGKKVDTVEAYFLFIYLFFLYFLCVPTEEEGEAPRPCCHERIWSRP
ncbi:hypothetical protein E2C01_093439 [Portunus trituberculatus]|uniref:Uncharacterized protein n=1 Tax=Portunus trituberculatus TaxID=210409 RepID=A0A5B7JYS3_PORTR|nr:hypothetical protein [Portunus trituberculatus]